MPDIDKVIAQIVSRNFDQILKEPEYPYRLLCQELLQFPVGRVEDVDRIAENIIDASLTGTLPIAGVFHSLSYALFLRTQRPEFRQMFVDGVRKHQSLPRSPEGVWLHPRGRFGKGYALLLDSLQEEASQTAILSTLPDASGDEAARCVEQFRLMRQILRDPATGFWRNGRGWLDEDPQALSPAPWSRGHGWLMRGLLTSILNLSPGAEREELVAMLRETAESLISVVDARGMWPVLLDRPSAPEVSGSAMIAAVFLSAVSLDLLPDHPYHEVSLQTAETVFTDYVDAEGRITGVCPGPGPLMEVESYLGKEFSLEDPHGPFAVCALASAVLQTR
jgi:rhamnogalacturonyl hydrolase YesR